MGMWRVAAVLLLMLPAFAGFALDPEKRIEQYLRAAWNADRGLPQSTVLGITQTRDRFIWIATQEGFVRFDGAEFVTYDKRNYPQIQTHFSVAVRGTRDGSLYVGTLGGGLLRLRDGRVDVFTEQHGLPSNHVAVLLEGSDGSVWIGTTEGLARMAKHGSITRFPPAQLSDVNVTALAEDSSGGIWIATESGLASMHHGRVVRHDPRTGFPAQSTIALAPSRDGSMWIGTDAGLFRYRAGEGAKPVAPELANDKIIALHEDRSGTLWLGVHGRGFGKLMDGNLEFASGSQEAVSTIFEDVEGNLWIGSISGLERLSDGVVATFSRTEGLLDDDVKSVTGDSSGAVWVATREGVQNLMTGQKLTPRQGLSSANVLSTLLARDGTLWIGTFDAGLNRVRGREIVRYSVKDGLPSDVVLALFEDRRGVLWVGTSAGVTRIVNEKINSDGLPPVLDKQSVSSIAETHDGAIWIGSHDIGLTRLGANSVSSFSRQNGLSDNFVVSIHEDSDGTVWIGTAYGGLNRYKDGKLAAITSSHGLQDDSVFSILEDDDRNLWMSSNKGIFRATLNDLNAVADGRRGQLRSAIYGRTDGMKSRECNGGFQPVAWKGPKGKLWFATTGGVAVVDPAKARGAAPVAPVLVQDTIVDKQRLQPGAHVPAGHRTLEIHYTSPTFKTPDKLRFQYRLEGFDHDWVDAASRRVAYYTNVPYGNYSFQVRAHNGEGQSAASAIPLIVEPFFYQRPVFWALMLIAFFSAIWMAHQYRVRIIRASAERFKLLFDRNLAGVLRARIDGLILDCNQAGLRILGLSSLEQLAGRSIFDSYTNPTEAESLMTRLRNHGAASGLETSLRRPDGTPIWVLQNVNLAQNQGQEILEATLIDITDRKRAEEQIRYQAYHDALTSLPNRSLFKEQLSLAVAHAERRGRQVAVLFLDLDRFKLINDTLGHTIGDHLLQGMADRLKSCVREEDSVARVGGDEFTILLMDLRRPADAMVVARKILDIVSRPMDVDGHELYTTCSIGIAMSPADGTDAETLLKNADNALYRAKEAGKNNYQLCTPSMTQLAAERLAVENALRQAIDRDEFLVLYQPQYDLGTRRVVSVEALLRWDRPGFGIVGPAQFIAAAEESRLIVPIGEWVIDTATEDANRWNGDVPVRIAVNVSPAQFRQKHLVRAIRTSLQEHSLDPTRLEVEITESTAMQNPTVTAEILEELKNLGVSIVIDDFGIGHSSLNYLKRFPIDGLKIDRTFVQDLTTDASDAGIVAAIIAMAHALNLRVTAEGVETEEQLEFLESHGCTSIQGYLVGRPVAADEITEIVRSGFTLPRRARVRSVS